MLQLIDIRKSYTTGDFTQVALDDISVSFRDSEFVAVLGPSGSGKTTMLNIIGGLDQYDSGDLVVDGISTKEYKDRDWDAFRNNRIGFVFQSYNLIPHQTVLQNVELALTLSGVGKEERQQRASKALEEVGLGEHVNKKPSQLSGGQMQRVAIARALINDPEILLADEPTGALDSKTSVQIMDLLTQIARDRLVVMVTHNPELAESYATRIVNLADGEIVSDSDPFEPTSDDMHASKKMPKRTRMGFLTALGLSFNNLMTKKGRTIMTAFAGSIGIIGIAAILSLANGVNNYIKSVEEETLSSYPLQITSQGFDITSMMVSSMDVMQGDEAESGEEPANVEDTVVGEANIVNRVFDSVGSNDLASLKEYIDSGESDMGKYVQDIQYMYDITPYIYMADTEDGVQKINPDTTFSSLGIGSSASGSSVMSTMMSTDMFSEMHGTLDMAKESYDLKAGKWPEKYNECVLVLTENGRVSDFLLYVLGLRDRNVLQDMVKAFMNEEEVQTEVNDGAVFTYKDFFDLKLKLVCSADFYEYDADYNVWVDKSDDEEYMKARVAEGEDIVISGIIQPSSDTSMMTSGIYYTPLLSEHLIEMAGNTQIVKDQLAEPTVDVFSGKSFTELAEKDDSDFDMTSMFSIDTGAIQAAFKVDASKMTIDPSAFDINFDSSSLPKPPPFDPGQMELPGNAVPGGSDSDVQIPEVPSDAYETALKQLANGLFQAYALAKQENPSLTADEFLESETAQLVIGKAASGFAESQQSAMQQMQDEIKDGIQQEVQQAQQEMGRQIEQAMSSYVRKYMADYMEELMSSLTSQMRTVMEKAMSKATSQLAASIPAAMSIDEDAFMSAFSFDMTEDELRELMMSLMKNDEATFDGNLSKLDYAEISDPYEIDIFPSNFEDKQHVIDILDEYNNRMNVSGQEDKAITYTDIVGALMSSVTTIIDMISYVLIAFVSISLIVSSIMIGVITYISVLERKKEIGILRAIGASKGDISRVFNAETVIEGLVAGILGVGITAIGCIPASAIVYSIFDVPNVASLPWQAAIVLVLISVLLTFIAGIIPASSASRKDPVEALRSE